MLEIDNETFVSPVADIVGPSPVAAFEIVNSLTAFPFELKISISAPLASAINPPSINLGSVKVLLVSI